MISYRNLLDIKLSVLLRQGDQSAFTEIHRRYFSLVYVEALRKLNDEETAKDIVQDLFLNLWLKREKLPDVNNLAGYLITATKHTILNFFEHQSVKSKYITSLTEYVNTGNIAHTDYLVREREWANYIDEAIELLPSRMKEIFQLSKKENLSYKEIAKKLNTSENNIQKHINGAIKILKTKLTVFF